MPVSEEVLIKITTKVDKALKDIGRINQRLTSTGKASETTASKLKSFKTSFMGVATAATAVGYAFYKVLKVGIEFEQSIANVASVSGGAKEELSALARTAGKTTVFSAKQAAGAMYFLASAGLKTKAMTKVLTPALNLAAAAQMGIAEATDMVVNNLKIYNADMEDAAEYVDIMAMTVKSANTDMTQLGGALSYAASTAMQAGISFEDLNVMLAAMANMGVKGERAGTQIRMAFNRLIKPTREARDALAKYGISVDEVTSLLPTPIKLFQRLEKAGLSQADGLAILGVRQADVFGLIKRGIPDMIELRDQMENAGGTAQKMADIQLDTLQGKMKLLNSQIQETAIAISSEMIPGLTNLSTALLESAKDGGLFSSTLTIVAKGLGTVFSGIAHIISALDSFQNKFKAVAEERAFKYATQETKEFKEAIVESYGSVSKLKEKADAGSRSAQNTLKKYKSLSAEQVKYSKGMVEIADKSLRISTQVHGKETDNLNSEIDKRLKSRNKERINTVDAVTKTGKDVVETATETEKDIADLHESSIAAKIASSEAYFQYTSSRLAKEVEAENDRYHELLMMYDGHTEKIETIEKQHQENLAKIKQGYRESESSYNLTFLNESLVASQQVMGQLNDIMNQAHNNQLMRLDNEHQKKMGIYMKEYNIQKDLIEENITDEIEKEKALKDLDDAKAAYEEKLDKERRKMVRKQAKLEKAAAIVTATINTAMAVTKAYSQGGFFGGPAFAAVVGALGATQIAFIAAQPLPEAAEGGLIKGSQGGTILRAGEGGKSEAIIPLENDEAMEKLPGGNNVFHFNDCFFANEEWPSEVIEKIDRGMYKLNQDNNSTFAEAVI